MTREQAKGNLVSIGVNEPTEEQITNYLNQVNGETKKEKERADKFKAEADEVIELRKQLEEKEKAGLDETELLRKEVEELKAENAKQLKLNKDMELKAGLAKQGIIGEEADKIVESIGNGTFDTDLLGSIIAKREAEAVANKEKELLKGTPDPNGKGGNDNDESLAKEIGQSLLGTAKTSSDIISQYK